MTLIVYGLTETLSRYGFIAVFVAAVTVRDIERNHEYHLFLHSFAEKIERVVTVGILIALGGALAGGLLDSLTIELVLVAALTVFVIRPLAGLLGLIGFDRVTWSERMAISFFGIRGIGSLYYLSHAVNKKDFIGSDKLWALVCLIIVISIFVHGITVTPITKKLDQLREQRNSA